MRVVVQRVSTCSVTIDKTETRKSNQGLLVLLGIEPSDTDEDIEWLCKKLPQLRIFDDGDGKMNLSVQDIKGQIMVISQFTLFASTKKGNRPSFIEAAKPDIAIPLYKKFVEILKQESGLPVSTGEFGAYMEVTLVNDGPVTILMDTKNKE